uniref:Uncharacterized protein n=1 Tax=Rhizobium rhizogenes TaxID=359 RepID=A0A7S4ZSV3_RHIRH|nr:hypothetical protein pC5.7c_517 [Rhizobium rhizogenes]QCL09554.1 hypothetical protein pC5.8a_62 [Rhizobium rhizogenes]
MTERPTPIRIQSLSAQLRVAYLNSPSFRRDQLNSMVAPALKSLLD